MRVPGSSRTTVMLVVGIVVAFMLGSMTTAYAAAKINGKSIKKGSIPLSALSNDAKKALGAPGPAGPAGPAGAAGAAAARYWAVIGESGNVLRSSGGVSGNYNTNGGTTKQYTVRFPTDITQCAYSVTTGDTDPIPASNAVDGYVPGVTRGTADNNTLAISLWLRNTANNNFVNSSLGQSIFYVAVFC